MNTAIEKKFINMVSPSLTKFKWKKDGLATCRCFKCGDSQRNKSKTRGYFYINKDHYYYKCHNCGFSCTIKTVLENISPNLAKEYAFECYQSRIGGVTFQEQFFAPTERVIPDYIGTSIIDLPENHYARKYVNERKIPEDKQHLLYFVDDFSKIATKFFKTSIREPRLVIPFFDDEGKVIGVQGRSFDKNAKIRYITYKSPHVERLWYGLDRVNALNKVYVVEGPLDSLFLPNAIAMVGSSYAVPPKLKRKDLVFAFDNEPRNQALHNMMKEAIDDNYKIVVWPKIEEKDINEMFVNYGKDKLMELIDTNTYSGGVALLNFLTWRKV